MRSSAGKGVSGISLTELADAVSVSVLAEVMPIKDGSYTWNKQSSTGGDLEWHYVTDWGGDTGYEQDSSVVLRGMGGNVYLCGFNKSTDELKASALELNDASWTFRSVGTMWRGADDVDALPDEVDPTHILTVTGDLTIKTGAGLLLGEQTTIDVQGKLVTGEGAPLSLGESSKLSIGKIGDKTGDLVALSSLTFESGSRLKVGGFGMLSMQSVHLDGNATLEMDVSGMESKDKQLKLKFGESADFTQSGNYLTIKLTGLKPENLKKLTDQGGVGGHKLQDEAYYIFGEGTYDQGVLRNVLNIVTWDKDKDPYSPFYVYVDPDTDLIAVKVKDHDLYWKHVVDDHNWRVDGSDGLSGNPQHWEKDTTPGKDKAGSPDSEDFFPSGDQVWHGDVYFGDLANTDEADYKSYTRDGSPGKAYSFYRVYFEGGKKQDMGTMEHIAVSMRGNMTVGKPKEGGYYWFKPRYDPSFPYTDGGKGSGAVDENGNIHLERDGHEQHQFQLVIGRADTGNFTEDKLILESSVRFSGNVAFNANVMTNFVDVIDPYEIADGKGKTPATELMVGDGATFYRALNKSKRDESGKVTEYGFDGTLVIWSQNPEKEEGKQYKELVANRLREGGDIIHLHVEQEVGGRLQIGKDGEEATYDGTIKLTVEELTGGVKALHGDGDIYGDTLVLNDNGRQEVAQYDGTIASSLEYSRSENSSDEDGRVYFLNNDFRGPRLTVKEGRFEVQYLRPMFNGVYKWLKGKGDPESEGYVYDEKYDTDSRVVVEKDGKLTIEYLTPASKAYEGDGSAASGAWCDVVVMGGEGEEGGGQLNFELWKSQVVTSEDVPVKSLWTGAGSEVTIGQPSEQGNTQTARKLTVKYLGGAGGTIKDVVEGGDKSTLILDYDKPDPEDDNYGVYRKEFEGEYAEFDHYDGNIEVNLTYTGTAGADNEYTLDGHRLDGFRLNGEFLGDLLTMDGPGKLTLTKAVGSLGGDGKEDWTVEEGGSVDVRRDVTVNQGLLVLEEESHIGTLEGSGTTSGTLMLEKGGSIQGMEKVERAGGTGAFQTGLQLEVADHLTLNTGDFYFDTFSTKEADDVVHLFFELKYTKGGSPEELTGTKVHVNHFRGLTQSTLWVEADADIVDALKSYLDGHPGNIAEWKLFDEKEFKQTEYRGFFLNYDQNTDLGNDRRIFYLSTRGSLVMEDLQAAVHWLGKGAFDESAQNDIWEAKSKEKDWRLEDRDSDQVLRSIETAFRKGDNIYFDTEGVEENGTAHTTVTYSGGVNPYNMTVEDPEGKGAGPYTFKPADGKSSIVVDGDLEINSKAVFKNGDEDVESNVTVKGRLRGTGATLEVQDGKFMLETELAETGSDRFFGVLSMGVLKGNNNPTVTLKEGGTLYGLEMHDGTLNIGEGREANKSLTLRGLGGESGKIAGGALRLEANGEFGGEVNSSELTYKGTSFELYGRYSVEGALTVESGTLKITGNSQEGGTLQLDTKRGSVLVKDGSHLVLGGQRYGHGEEEWVENVEVVGNLTLDGIKAAVSMEGTESNTVKGNVELKAGSETSLTMSGLTNKIDGDVTLNSGTTLSMSGTDSREITGKLTLYAGAKLNWHLDELVVGDLQGDGTVDNGGILRVGRGTDKFGGFFSNLTGLTLDDGTLRLTQVQQLGLGAVTVGAESTSATLTFEGEENTASSLTFGGTESSVKLGTEDHAATLELSNLKGDGTIEEAAEHGNDDVKSSVSLKYNEKEAGKFGGNVKVDFEYTGSAAGDPGFTLGGDFTGENLTVHAGKLTVSSAVTDVTKAVTLSGSSTLTLAQGGDLTMLNGGNGNLVLGSGTHIHDMGGSSLTSLHVRGQLWLEEKKYGLGDVTLDGDTTLKFDFHGENVGTEVALKGLGGIGAGGHAFTLQFSEDALEVLKGLGAAGYHLFFEDDGICEWNGLVDFSIMTDEGEELYDQEGGVSKGSVYLDDKGILHWKDMGPGSDGIDGALTWRAEDGEWQNGPDSAESDPLDTRDWFGHREDLPVNRDNFTTDRSVRFTEYYVSREHWNVKVNDHINAGNMSVTGGDYTFTSGGKDEKGNPYDLSVDALDISSVATAEFSVTTQVDGNLTNAGGLTVKGAMNVDGTLTGKGDTTVTGSGGSLTVGGETDYAGTLTLEKDGSLTAHGAVKDLHVGAGGGNLTANGDTKKLEAELTSGTNAGQLDLLSGTFDLTGRTAGAVKLGAGTVLNAYNLSVGGVNGNDAGATLSGTLTVTGAGKYAGDFENLDLTVANGGKQEFTKPGSAGNMQTLKSARVEAGGELDLADQTEVSGALTVDGTVTGSGYLKAPSLQGTAGEAQVTAGTLELTGAAGSGSQYAGSVKANGLLIQRGTHTFGNADATGVTLNNGSHLHVGGKMTLTGSLTLTLSDVYKGSSLMSAIGTQTFEHGAGQIKLDLTPVGGAWSNLSYGVYYLITEEVVGDDLKLENFDQTGLRDGLAEWAQAWQDKEGESGFIYEGKLDVIEEGHSLVLNLMRTFDRTQLQEDDDLVWHGDGATQEDIWRDDVKENWWPGDRSELKGTLAPKDRNLFFLGDDEGSDRRHMVHVDGLVNPRNVYAYDGEYTFVQDGEGDGGIQMEAGERFVVDGGRLHMQMKNKSIPKIELKSGAFFIEHEAAVPEKTQVAMSGGLLGFGESRTVVQEGENAGDGELFKNKEVWKTPEDIAQHLFLEANGRLRVQAGKTYAEFMQLAIAEGKNIHGADYIYHSPAGEDKEDLEKDVVIGRKDVTPKGQQNVVLQALAPTKEGQGGVEKTGRFGLTLRWSAGEMSKVSGPISVGEGRLTLQSFGTEKVTLEGALVIAKGGTLHLWGDKKQTVEVASSFTATDPSTPRTEWLGDKSESRVVLGCEDDDARYNVNGDNSEYDGTIVLRGNSGRGEDPAVKDTAVFKNAEAAGHNEQQPVARLELHGRALTFDKQAQPEADGSVTVNVEGIEVSDGTENLVGGYAQVGEGDPNAKIALSGPLTGTGVLANAYSAGKTAFQHTYTGALRGFGGTIVAGLWSTAPEGSEDKSGSIWTLNLTDAAQGDHTYNFKMAGTGEIKLNADADITLTGVVGDQTDGHLGDTVDLTNIGQHNNVTLAGHSTTKGKLTTNANGGNFILEGQGAAWAGTVLQGGGSFTLREGTLTSGGTFKKPTDGSKLTVDAKGTVNVRGMDVDKSGMGDITITGTSTVGEGEAQRVRHGQLVGVASDITTEDRLVTLKFSEDNVVGGEGYTGGLISFRDGDDGKKHNLVVTQGDANTEDGQGPKTGLVLDFTTEALVGILKSHRDTDTVTDLQVVENGAIDLWSHVTDKDETDIGDRLQFLMRSKDGGYGQLLSLLGFSLNGERAADGILSLSGTSMDVYLVLNKDEHLGTRDRRVMVGDVDSKLMEKSASVVVDHDVGFGILFTDTAFDADGIQENPSGTPRRDVTLKNLIGLEKSTLYVNDERSKKEGHVTVNLVNELAKEGEVQDQAGYGNGQQIGDHEGHTVGDGAQNDGFNVHGQDTTFEGTITGEETVDFVKKGAGQLTVGSEKGNGGLDVKGVLRLEEGGVTLQTGTYSELGTLAFNYAAKGTGLTLARVADLTVHHITEKGTVGGDITLGEKSVLTFDNSGRADKSVGTTLKDTHIKAAAAEEDEESKKKVAGEFVVKGKGTELTLAGASSVEGVNVTVGEKPKPEEEEQKDAAKVASEAAAAVPDGLLTVQGDAKVDTEGTLTVQGDGKVDLQGSTGNRVGSLVGDGTLSGEDKARLTVTGSDSDFHGTLTTSTPGTPEQQRGSATLGVVDGAVLSLKDVITDPARAWNLDIVRKGTMVLGKTEAARNEKQMRFGDIDVQGGGNLTIEGEGKSYVAGDVRVDKSNGEKMNFKVGLNGEKGRIWLDLTFNEKGGNELDNPGSTNAKNVEDFVDLGFEGVGSSHYEGYLRREWNPQNPENWVGQWYIGLEKRKDNPFFRWGDHKNVQAGAALAWDADDPDSMAGGYLSSPEGKDGDLAHAIEAVKDGATEEDRLLAALAGSSISTLTAAMIEDVKRQLESLRSRAAMLSNSEPRGNLEMDKNKWQAWINAEMGRHDLDHESWGPGYRLIGWGGTVGGGYEMSPRTTLGLAVTAMYNDITTDGADFAKGDIDFVYLSSFMRTHLGRWTHTVLAAVAAVDVSLDRTVRYETAEYAGSYKTFGSSRGMAMGFEYELAYNKKLNESGTFVVQPLFNLQYRHAHVNAYTEKGSDAGLYINEVKTNLFTLGLGSRLQGVISDDAFGHTSFFEGRAMLKMDTGHNTGRANVRFKHGNLAREVESGPTGIFGIEIGAGCTVSLGIRGATFFVDSSAEFRDHYTNINASTGFRLSF